MGMKYANLLLENSFSILGLYETNMESSEKAYRNNFVVETVALTDKPVIISSFKYYDSMKEKLLQLGYSEQQIVSPLAVFEEFYIPKFEKAFYAFEDELSQKIVLDKIRYLVLEPKMNPISAYFDSLMEKNLENEIFIDGGAFDGETTKEFAFASNRKYKKIYCFEPTKSNYNLAVKKLKGFENIEIINKGLYSREAILEFKDFGTDEWNAVNDYFMGHEWDGPAMEYKLSEMPVISLDYFFQDKSMEEYPTIIKLDIEGSEKEALLGMRNVLNVSHPKLIICAYHKMEDYFELAQTIKEICPGYKLKLRHYTDGVQESIIFGHYEG